MLEALGHHFLVQAPLVTPHGTKKPDFVFFPDEAGRQAAKGRTLDEAALRGALAVGDAKRWDRPLDQRLRGRESESNANPSFQIDFYIRHSGLPWGILTNGRLWRLYHHDTSKALDVYYEVDLPALLQRDDPAAWNYFFLFFRREAFEGETSWLASVLARSHEYERGVGDSLKGQVYEALAALANGFLAFPANRLATDPATLKAIYDNSLIVLYRLLFILYAESRALLPLHQNEPYTRRYSLDALKQRVAREVDSGAPAVPTMASLWNDLHGLWQVIDQGDPHLGVPAYNGGLFNPSKHPFLEKNRVGRQPPAPRPRPARPHARPRNRPARLCGLPRPGGAAPGQHL